MTTLVPPVHLAVAQTTQYTATNVRAIIDMATVTNTSAALTSFSINLVQPGGVPSNANLVIDTKLVQPDETYLCREIIGHSLNPGAFISTTASAAAALSLRISGREIS
jgi:hypothetical protein